MSCPVLSCNTAASFFLQSKLVVLMVLEVTPPIYRLRLLLVLLLTPRGFSLGILSYPST